MTYLIERDIGDCFGHFVAYFGIGKTGYSTERKDFESFVTRKVLFGRSLGVSGVLRHRKMAIWRAILRMVAWYVKWGKMVGLGSQTGRLTDLGGRQSHVKAR